MKNVCLLFIITVLSISGFSQTPFARPEAHWCIITMYPSQTTYSEPLESYDTTVLGIPCSAIPDVGYLFVRNDTVFRMVQDSIRFLYDYSAQAGDLWYIDSVPVHIDSATVVSVRGQNLRLIFTSVIDTPHIHQGIVLGTVLEGVGTPYYFLPGPWALVDDGIPYRYCFQDSVIGAISEDRGHISLLDSCVCHVWMGEKLISAPMVFSLIPNPASSSFTLHLSSLPTTLTHFLLYDALGRPVMREEITAETTTIQRGHLPSGIYFWQVQSVNNILKQGKLVLH